MIEKKDLKIDLVSYPARAEGLGKDKYMWDKIAKLMDTQIKRENDREKRLSVNGE